MKKVLEIKTIGDTKYHCTAGYFPDNKWLDNDTFVYQRSEDPTIACEDWEGKVTSELVRLSLKDNSEEVLLSDRIFGYHYVIFGDKIYYSDRKNLKVFDIKSKKTDILYTNNDYYPDDNAMALMCPTVTNDGKYISVYISGRNPEHSMAKIIVLETETGHVRYTFEAGGFARPFQYADHVMICPTDPDLVYFCHEGTTEYVSNRMWLYDAKSGKKYNFAKQRLDEDGNLGDCFGHEMWAPDGRGMYFV